MMEEHTRVEIVPDFLALQRGRPAVLTIGAFDGVHRGHQYLIGGVAQRARNFGGISVVVTFDPRPQIVLRPGSLQLTDASEKARLIAQMGPDTLVALRFTRELMQVRAGDFVQSILDRLNLKEIWIGADFAFGNKREGNVQFLIDRGQADGFDVHVVARQDIDGERISSTRVREFVEAGNMAAAERLLGHHFRISGPVTSGHGRGAGLGYPTANVQPPPHQVLPATGIYAAWIDIDGSMHPAAVSVGYNVQFNGDQIRVEAFVLDFEGNLRGRTVGLDFVERLRDEQRFANVDELIAAMDRDVARTREILHA